MTFYDLTHAYQPFEPPNFIPDWVEENLRNIFIPVSRAMREGVIKHNVQLQGWTIDAFLKSPEPIKGLATERKPHPYWDLPVWVEFINSFCEVYNNDFPKSYLAVLASDVPWYLLARKEWGTYPPHSYEFTRKVIFPIVEKIGSAKLTAAAQKLYQSLEVYIREIYK